MNQSPTELKPNLGLATTAELLHEITTRIEIDYYQGGGGLGYTTVKGRPDPCRMCGQVHKEAAE